MRILKMMISGCLILAGCVPSYPLGMNEAQWNALPYEQRQQILAEQAHQEALQHQQQEALLRQQQEQQIQLKKQQLEEHLRHRLGITETEWNQFTAEKQFELRHEQESIERNQQQTASNQQDNDAQALGILSIAEALHARNTQELYTNAAYGLVVNCTIQSGNAKFSHGFHHKWSSLLPTHFSIAKGDAKEVNVRRLDRQKYMASLWVAFTQNHELEFCANRTIEKRYKQCRVYPVTPQFEKGFSAPISIPNAIDNAILTCQFAPGRR